MPEDKAEPERKLGRRDLLKLGVIAGATAISTYALSRLPKSQESPKNAEKIANKKLIGEFDRIFKALSEKEKTDLKGNAWSTRQFVTDDQAYSLNRMEEKSIEENPSSEEKRHRNLTVSNLDGNKRTIYEISEDQVVKIEITPVTTGTSYYNPNEIQPPQKEPTPSPTSYPPKVKPRSWEILTEEQTRNLTNQLQEAFQNRLPEIGPEKGLV